MVLASGHLSFVVATEEIDPDTGVVGGTPGEGETPPPVPSQGPVGEAPLLGFERNTQNLYAVSPIDASLTLLGTLSKNLVSLEYRSDGFLYGFTTGGAALYQIDPETLQSELVGSLGIGNIFEGALAFAPDGTAYGTNSGTSSSPSLFTLDLTTGNATVVGVISGAPHDINGMAWRGDDMLVGLDRVTNALLAIDPQNAQSSVIAVIPPVVGVVGGMAILNETAFLATSGPDSTFPGSNELYTVDLFTGATTLIGSFSPTIAGIGISGLAARVQGGGDGVPAVSGRGLLVLMLLLLTTSTAILLWHRRSQA